MARKRSAIVPRAVFGVSFGGVVPACVAIGIQACSNSGPLPGVAAVAYCCFEASVPPDADASDGDAVSDTGKDAPSDAELDVVGDVKEGG